MRAILAWSAALVLVACGQSVSQPLVGNVPTAAKLPDCPSLKVSHNLQTVVDGKTMDSVTFAADTSCVQSWAKALGKNGDETGTLHSSFEAKTGILVTISRGQTNPNSVTVIWIHDGTLPAIINGGKTEGPK